MLRRVFATARPVLANALRDTAVTPAREVRSRSSIDTLNMYTDKISLTNRFFFLSLLCFSCAICSLVMCAPAFTGYHAAGCDCSGHGYCKTIGSLAQDNAGITYARYVDADGLMYDWSLKFHRYLCVFANSYSNWDADVIQTCYCDDAYTGYDCSQSSLLLGDCDT